MPVKPVLLVRANRRPGRQVNRIWQLQKGGRRFLNYGQLESYTRLRGFHCRHDMCWHVMFDLAIIVNQEQKKQPGQQVRHVSTLTVILMQFMLHTACFVGLSVTTSSNAMVEVIPLGHGVHCALGRPLMLQ